MKSTNKKAIENILLKLDEYSTELTGIQDEENSETLDQVLDDLAMVIDGLNTALEE